MVDLSAERWLDAFADHLQRMEKQDERLSRVSSFWNGFEGWLKFEMAAMLVAPPWNYQPWITLPTGNVVPGDVGVEYRATLAGGDEKLVDVWASPRREAGSWLFAELKVAFRNGNAGKQLEGWTRDFAKLRRIDRRFTSQRVSSVTSVLFGVGFTAAQFEEATERATAGMEIDRRWVRNLEAGDLPLCIHAITGDAQ